MDRSSLVLLGVLLTVCMVHGKCMAIDDGLQDQDEAEVSAELKLPGVCWACKWALDKVKKTVANNSTAAVIRNQLLSVCNKIGLLKSLCRKFVKANLGVLIEELTTTDDVRTICVNVKACKPKEAMMDAYYPEDSAEMFSGHDMEE